MTTRVNIHEAKSQLSKLIEEAQAGEEVIVSKAGTPMVRLTPLHGRPPRRVPGAWSGKVWMTSDFDETPEDIIDEWYSNLEDDE